MSHPPPEYPAWVAYEPGLVPPLDLMGTEGITVLEEWFRWAEEWSMVLRVYGRLARASRVLEIGCGLGRIAFPLRYILSSEGRYTGFDIVRRKIEFLERAFHPAHPNFDFVWADVRNTYYNPTGRHAPTDYRFPAEDATQDVVFAASVFTHMLPQNTAHYLRESARVLVPGGRCVVSVFLLDRYRRGLPRPTGFDRPDFDFDHGLPAWGEEFAYVNPENQEQMTAYREPLIARFAAEAGLTISSTAPGLWSGTADVWVGAQDLVVLTKPD
ncbi:MAG: class I SAM-dependent methyltransferase [Gemmatimonadaceae bacterium]